MTQKHNAMLQSSYVIRHDKSTGKRMVDHGPAFTGLTVRRPRRKTTTVCLKNTMQFRISSLTGR
jgi:hypothetical protein